MSNFPKISVEKSLLIGPTDPAHEIPGPSPDLPGIAGINGPLIIGGKFDGYVADRYTNAMICVVPPSEEVYKQIGVSTVEVAPSEGVNPLSISGELFGPLADAITISKQGNPASGSGNRYDGVGIRVNANAHLIECGEITFFVGPLFEVDSEAFFYRNVNVGGNVIAEGEVVSNNGSHVLSTKKNFDIPHPTKEGWRLTHSCIEGPEAAVYFRGKLINQNTIKLPKYWEKLVDPETITVSITPINSYQNIFVKKFDITEVILESTENISIHCFYHIFGERIDTEKLVSEYEGNIEDYPGDNSQRSISGYHYDKKQLN